MLYQSHYASPLGEMTITVSKDKVEGVWFSDQDAAFARRFHDELTQRETFLTKEVISTLEDYFCGKSLPSNLPLHFSGTLFQNRVWQALQSIPYGKTVTYKEIANQIDCQSFQAVGRAIGQNPFLIIVPCHRVIPVKGGIGEYSAGRKKKAFLIQYEKQKS